MRRRTFLEAWGAASVSAAAGFGNRPVASAAPHADNLVRNPAFAEGVTESPAAGRLHRVSG